MQVLLLALISLAAAQPVWSKEPRAGHFDYYVLSLSWSPTWCDLTGTERRSPQCAQGAGFGWILHGLWPQYDRGWPSYCPTALPAPSERRTDAMVDITGTSRLAKYQWRKHGVCTGLSAPAYFDLSRKAYGQITRPDVFHVVKDPVTLPASVVEEAFLQANPQLSPDMITITCKQGRIQEARICLSRTLVPVACGADVIRDCTLRDALFDPIR